MNENFEAVGFESVFLINNMGTLAIAYLIWILAAFFTMAVKIFIYEFEVVRRTHRMIHRKLFWNSIISLFLESYSLLAVCSMINFSYISFESYGMTIHSIACLSVLIAIFFLPALVMF